jgi:hypothetical protein
LENLEENSLTLREAYKMGKAIKWALNPNSWVIRLWSVSRERVGNYHEDVDPEAFNASTYGYFRNGRVEVPDFFPSRMKKFLGPIEESITKKLIS